VFEEAFRKELIRLCRSRSCSRIVPRSREMPCHWFPTQVKDPETGDVFTAVGAWHFVAELLEKGVPMTILKMNKPEGSWAFVIKYYCGNSGTHIYIKVQMYSGTIVGRSFHYSTVTQQSLEQGRM
jgi:hypothetical protein